MLVVLVTFLHNISPLQKNIQKTNRDRRTGCPEPADEKKWSQLRALVTSPPWGWAGRRFRWYFHVLWRNKFLSDAIWFLEKQSSCSLSFILDWKREKERKTGRGRREKPTGEDGWEDVSNPCLAWNGAESAKFVFCPLLFQTCLCF